MNHEEMWETLKGVITSAAENHKRMMNDLGWLEQADNSVFLDILILMSDIERGTYRPDPEKSLVRGA